MSLANKFHLRAGWAFEEIEEILAKLQSDMASLRAELQALRAERRAELPPPIGHRWSYRVVDPAYFTDALGACEQTGSGVNKRWVLGDRSFDVTLRLRRDLTYLIGLELCDIRPDSTVRAKVDGVEVPVERDNKAIRFLAPRDLERFKAGEGLTFSLTSDPIFHDGSGDDKRVLSFSFSAIDVTPVEVDLGLAGQDL
ncbi:MAG: hypothetical protein IE927_09255 [Rhodobacterales bacterium]|nr:hypothetical protein [Rhodobacterales bacterium]